VGALYHAAGELDDRLLVNQSRESLQRVFQAKVHGSWNLHEVTTGLGLRLFVLFSSIAAVFGSRGQGNYAAGNAFMDSLAHYRRHLGLPAVSINWGAWGGAGMASDERAVAAIRSQGVGFLDVEVGLRGLEHCLAQGTAQVVFASFDAAVIQNMLLSRLHTEGQRRSGALAASRGAGPARTTVMQGVADPLALQALLADRVAAVLGMSPAALDAEVPLQTYGMDSLMAMELRTAVGTMLGVTLPGTLLFDYPSVSALARHLWERFQPADARGPGQRLAAGAAGAGATTEAVGRGARAGVAITGMACRFPQCGSVAEYWAFMESGPCLS
jgi:myxalamid-type polyketide synthase MxaE and MxaD